MSEPVQFPSGMRMSREQAEQYVTMLASAAAAMVYVSEPERWAGYVAWTEQGGGLSLEPGASEDVRQLYTVWADHMHKIATAGEGMIGDARDETPH